MRKAAGIILIISGIVGLIGLVIGLTGIYSHFLPYLHLILLRIASIALLVAGGVFCLRRRYWGACLASALVALFIGISSTIDYVRYIGTHTGHLGPISMTWGIWILLLGAVVSTIFICLRRSEWSKSQPSLDFFRANILLASYGLLQSPGGTPPLPCEQPSFETMPSKRG